MRFWGKGKLARLFCSGRLLRRAPLALLLVSSLAGGQVPQKPQARKAAAHRANELTLAGLRPGRDGLSRAMKLYREIDPKSSTNDSQTIWLDPCRKQLLAVDFGADKKIRTIRAAAAQLTGDCIALPPSPWKTGSGLRVGDPSSNVVRLYGEPNSKSPSTRDGQPLELWYYAFDWAGADVPQVMEVLCTREKDGQPGRVEEITLAAASL